ncbi:hypothetical protein ACVWW1_003277 [Bradyrhizobium sp. JR3.5]
MPTCLPRASISGRRVVAPAVAWPVDRESAAHQPVRKVDPSDGADGNRSAVAVAVDLDARDRLPADELGERVRRHLPAAIALAAPVVAELVVLGGVDPVKAHARTMDFDGIAVDDARLPGHVAARACFAGVVAITSNASAQLTNGCRANT